MDFPFRKTFLQSPIIETFAILFILALLLNPTFASPQMMNLPAIGATSTADYCRTGAGPAGTCPQGGQPYNTEKAIDNTVNAWPGGWFEGDSGATKPSNYTIDLGATYYIVNLTDEQPGSTAYNINGFNVYTSTDNLTYTYRSSANNTAGANNKVNASIGANARYIRIQITSKFGAQDAGAVEFWVWNDTAPSTDSVNLTTPTNDIYVKNNITFSFLPISATKTTFPCWINLNGTFTGTGNATNNTAKNYNLSTGTGYLQSNVTCETNGNTTSNNANFWNYQYYFNQTVVESPVYEMANTTLSGTVRYQSGLTNPSVYMNYSGTSELLTHVPMWDTTGNAYFDKAITFDVTKAVALKATNATNNSVYFTAGDGASTWATSNTTNQTVYWSVFFESLTPNPINATEGLNFTATAILRTIYATGTRALNYSWNSTNISMSLYSSNATNENWLAYFITPAIGQDNQTFLSNATMNLTFQGTSITRQSASVNFTIFRIYLGNCTGPYAQKALNITLFDEESEAATTATVELNATFQSGTMIRGTNGTYAGANYYELCIYPTVANFQSNITFLYYAGTYATRYYFVENATISNTTSTVPLYLLPADSATNVTVTVQDGSGTNEAGIIVAFLRWKTGPNRYLTVSQFKTSGLASDVVPLKTQNVYYRIIVYKNGQIVLTKEPWYGSSTLTLTYNQNTIGNWWSCREVAGTCSESGTGIARTITCMITDTSGVSTNSNFAVLQGNQFGFPNTTIYQTSGNSPGVAYVYTVSNISENVFYYKLTADCSGDSNALYASGTIDGRSNVAVSNLAGIVATICIVGMAIGLGLYSPSAGMVLAGLGLILSKWLGILPVPTLYLTMILLGLGILALKVRA